MRDGLYYVAICDVGLLEESEGAGLFLIEGEEIWIPWSPIDESTVPEAGEEADLYVRRWIAIEKDLPF